MKYVCTKNNFGYMGTYWKVGAVVDCDSLPNKYFVPLDAPAIEKAPETEDNTEEKKPKRIKKT